MDFTHKERFEHFGFHHQRTETPDAGAFERHCHNRYELLYLKQGRGKFVVESAEYPLHPGMLLLLRPYEYHCVQPASAEPYERIVMNFHADVLSQSVRQMPMLRRQPGSAGLCFRCPAAAAVMENLTLCVKLDNSLKRPMAHGVLEQTLPVLSLAEPVAAESDPLMERVMQYLTDHLTEPLSLEGLSREFFLSRSHLCRAFRKHAGVTLLDYITAKRVAEARTLLQQGIPAAEAARQTGFSEYSTFYRAYKKHAGKSPSAVRKE